MGINNEKGGKYCHIRVTSLDIMKTRLFKYTENNQKREIFQ